ncbi:MAG: mercuric reductase [Bacteroidota bacterium]
MQSFDHIILGTGQATGTLLGKLIPTGDSIAVIEGGKIGGSCVNYGCTPTKALVASAKAMHMARRGAEFGFDAGPIIIDYDRVRERMDTIRNGSSTGLENWMINTPNVEVFRAWGKFEGPKQIRVGEHLLEGKNIYINVGTRPFTPPIEGLEEVPWMDSAGILDLEELPQHLIVIGGGYIGLEFSQIYRRFGSKVSLIQRNQQLMPREDADVAESVQSFLEEEGIRILTGTNSLALRGAAGNIELDIEKEGIKETLKGSHLLIATGRRPNSNTITLEAAGIKANEQGFIEVDDFCRTNVSGVYALGDVNGKGGFTHTAVNDAEIVLDYLFGGNRKISQRLPVYGLFTDPPLGRVGLSEKEALAQGHRVLKALRPMSKISRAKEMSETKGFAKLLVDADTDLIIGVSILGPGGDEVINMFAAIMHSGIPCRSYREVVLVHPTVSELMPWALDGLELIEV